MCFWKNCAIIANNGKKLMIQSQRQNNTEEQNGIATKTCHAKFGWNSKIKVKWEHHTAIAELNFTKNNNTSMIYDTQKSCDFLKKKFFREKNSFFCEKEKSFFWK